MSKIAKTLSRLYSNDYIKLFPKNNVIFEDGSTIQTEEAQVKYYVDLYQLQLENYSRRILKSCKNI